MARRTLALAGCGVLTVAVSACESTEQESARLAAGAGSQADAAAAGSLRLGASNRTVRVQDVTVLSAGGRTAVAARLTALSASAQADVPLLVEVSGASGKPLYSNGAAGLEPSLQRIAVLAPHRAAWWVDDQVIASQPAKAASVRVGTGRATRAGAGDSPAATGVHVGEQAGLSVVSGELVNHSSRALDHVPVFAVALRGGHVVAAGRAVVSSLPAGNGASAPFQAFLVGNPAGASIQVTVAAAAA
jgi:hypothetical protein